MMKNTVAMAKCYEYNLYKVEHGIRKVLDLLGGIEQFVKPGDKVLLKPNLVSPLKPSKAATTHPLMVEALCKILQEVGAEVWIGDSGVHGTSRIFTVTGIDDVAARYQCKICDIDNYDVDHVENEDNILMRKIPLSKYVTEADVVINIPKCKIHAGMVYTGAVKNLYGTIVGKNKSNIHGNTQTVDNFNLVLLDILNTVKPQLTIMDGVIGMEGNGPTNGSPKITGMILASVNPVALDLVALDQIGVKLKEVGYLSKAVEYGFSPKRSQIQVVGDAVQPVKYQHPSKILVWLGEVIMKVMPPIYNTLLKPVPLFLDECTQCKLCVNICPVDAISVEKGQLPKLAKKSCISCFCCHEACMSNAIIRSDEKKKKKKERKKAKQRSAGA